MLIVPACPQMLYLKVEAMEDKVRYLASIGVGAAQMGKVISRLPQLLSLNVANNMAPKFEYLRSELGGTVDTIAGFPAYFSLSMPQRCTPGAAACCAPFAGHAEHPVLQTSCSCCACASKGGRSLTRSLLLLAGLCRGTATSSRCTPSGIGRSR